MPKKRFHTEIDALVAAITAAEIQYPASIPNRDVIIEVIGLVRELLFPGYFGKQYHIAETYRYHVGSLLVDIHDKLNKQVHLALKHRIRDIPPDAKAAEDQKAAALADEIVLKFLNKIPELRATLAADVQAAFDGDPAAGDKDEIIFSYPGVLAVSIYRMAHELYLLAVPLIPRIMTEYAHNLTGIDIHAGATIGQYFFIDHGTGVVIGETTVIGRNVKLYQGVTLGALSTRGGQKLKGVRRHPTLEDEVTVYSGSSILGGETVIGHGVVIGSNVFITKSVPDRTKVSVKSPELLFRDQQSPGAGEPQMDSFDWAI